jgi:hypothetical protein
METIVKTKLVLPDSISPERISYLIHTKSIDPKIAAVNLEMVKMKLQDAEEGLGWSIEQCEDAEVEYKRYLNLCLLYGKGIVPNKIMDSMWHFHILDTRAYVNDCEAVFGHYLHHYPYFGMRGEEDAQNLKDSFGETKVKYEQAFNEPMVRDEQMKCWHDCENRCWHKCNDED